MIEYVKGTTKGESSAEDLVNGVYQLGKPDVNYTGSAVVETLDSAITNVSSLAFGPVVKLWKQSGADWVEVAIAKDGAIDSTTGKVKYLYDNTIVPQDKLPTLKAELNNIGLEAHARRISVMYSQLAAFQAKTDYGFDLADGLAEQAVGQLSYEIDTEIIDMLYKASPDGTVADATLGRPSIANFSKTQPVGVSLADHYAAFAAKIEEYKMAVYNVTRKFTPNAMVVASDVMPVLSFVPGFQPASVSEINGPYFAGTLNGLKVYVTPNMESGEFFFVVNQGAMQASAGVYAPYLPVIPTQLLGFADGGMTQGWSTMYDAKILNSNLLIKGQIVA